MVSALVNVPPPVMMLPVLLDIVTLPVPLRVEFPAMVNSVLLPELWRLMVPLFVMVPAPRARPLLFGISKVVPDEIVKLVSVGVFELQVFMLWITPPELEVNVPPVMLTAFSSTRAPDPVARIVPPVLVTVFSNCRVPPAVASSNPWLVVDPVVLL